jgi:hypothetical protein
VPMIMMMIQNAGRAMGLLILETLAICSVGNEEVSYRLLRCWCLSQVFRYARRPAPSPYFVTVACAQPLPPLCVSPPPLLLPLPLLASHPSQLRHAGQGQRAHDRHRVAGALVQPALRPELLHHLLHGGRHGGHPLQAADQGGGHRG